MFNLFFAWKFDQWNVGIWCFVQKISKWFSIYIDCKSRSALTRKKSDNKNLRIFKLKHFAYFSQCSDRVFFFGLVAFDYRFLCEAFPLERDWKCHFTYDYLHTNACKNFCPNILSVISDRIKYVARIPNY